MTLIAKGIFGWSSYERQTNRYGSFHVWDRPYEGDERVCVFIDRARLADLVGKRAHVRCLVTTSRPSTHLGDKHLGIRPTQPDKGEVVDLGVAVLTEAPTEYGDNALTLVLTPGDGRAEFWLDPHLFYRLHDQTVEVHAEETTEDFTPPVQGLAPATNQVHLNDDGSFQLKYAPHQLSVEPLGHGLFILDTTPRAGRPT